MNRGVVIKDGVKNLHSPLVALGEQVHIVLDARFVGGLVVAVGIDAGPADGRAENLQPQLLQQGQILFVGEIGRASCRERVEKGGVESVVRREDIDGK